MTAVRTPSAQGSPCWVSLMARDLETAQRFYGNLLGWEFVPGPSNIGPYLRATLNGAPVAGIGGIPPHLGFPVEWTTYFAAESTDDVAQRIRACGGTVAVGPLQADEAGRLAIASDLSGAVFGLWEWQGRQSRQVARECGTPVWNELVTSDPDGAAAFYGSVLGQKVEPAGPDAVALGDDDVVLKVDGHAVAGILGAAELRGGPPRWRVYFAVADADATAKRAVELGGQLLVAPEDTRFGRVARLCDPEGGRFSVVRLPDRGEG